MLRANVIVKMILNKVLYGHHAGRERIKARIRPKIYLKSIIKKEIFNLNYFVFFSVKE